MLLEKESRYGACLVAPDLLLTALHGHGPFPQSGYLAILSQGQPPKFERFDAAAMGTTTPLPSGKAQGDRNTLESIVADARIHRDDWSLLRLRGPDQLCCLPPPLGVASAGDTVRIVRFVADDERSLISSGALQAVIGEVLQIDVSDWPEELFVVRLEVDAIGSAMGPGSSGAPVFAHSLGEASTSKLVGIYLGKFTVDHDGRLEILALVRRVPRAEIERFQ
ncbi:MAG: hypothetical protein U0572_13080 [Phycisphaerales bacterium]